MGIRISSPYFIMGLPALSKSLLIYIPPTIGKLNKFVMGLTKSIGPILHLGIHRNIGSNTPVIEVNLIESEGEYPFSNIDVSG
jgi:hypothetical protein